MDLGLKGKRALVFGAGGGLGKAAAMSLAAEGAIVVAAGRTPEKLDATVREIELAGGVAHALTWDVKNIDVIDANMEVAKKLLDGSVQVLFNNGGGPPPSPAQGQPVQAWHDQFYNLVIPVIAITDAVLPDMKAANWGRILTNASSGVVTPIPGLAMSNSLRSSIVGWSKTLATEVGSSGITVNMVLPGRIATERLKFLDEARAKRENITVEEVERRMKGAIPLGRYGEMLEYGDTVAFLASERASYISGSMIRVDGGQIPCV
ncbi:MAG: SDR family oxidoreductase [Burkholderiaceae bacterium]|jgi:3-oxoacyl-[acyl-carrier protein] reductase